MSAVDPASIAGIGVDSVGWTLIPVDRAGNPLYPAMIWLDRRAEQETNWLKSLPEADTLVNLNADPSGRRLHYPKIDMAKEEPSGDRLKIVRDRVSVPLVLHGSSGVSDQDIKQGVAMGLCKVNVVTQLSQAFTGAVRDVLCKDKELVDPRKYLVEGRSAPVEIVRERLCFLGASGKVK